MVNFGFCVAGEFLVREACVSIAGVRRGLGFKESKMA